MTEDKAARALRKVIINFNPGKYIDSPTPSKEQVQIDISDKLDTNKSYYLGGVSVNYDGNTNSPIYYIPYERYASFKKKVEIILDAAIVNANQRASLQKLVNTAFYDSPSEYGMIY